MARHWIAALVVVAASSSGPHAAPRVRADATEAQSWAGAPGPAVGARVPAFELPDQDGRPRTLASLRGPGGLLLNFNRSVVW